jgi:hypothetical protein
MLVVQFRLLRRFFRHVVFSLLAFRAPSLFVGWYPVRSQSPDFRQPTAMVIPWGFSHGSPGLLTNLVKNAQPLVTDNQSVGKDGLAETQQ